MLAEEAAALAKKKKKGGSVAASMLRVLQAIGYTLFLLTTSDGEPSSLVEEAPAPTAKEKEKSPKAAMTFMLIVMIGFIIALPRPKPHCRATAALRD